MASGLSTVDLDVDRSRGLIGLWEGWAGGLL